MKDIFEMSGVERAAALLVAMGPQTAAEIMRHLDEESIEKLSLEIAKIDRLSPEEREDLIGEFLIDLRREKRRLKGGEGTAREMLTRTFGPDRADSILGKLTSVDIDREFADMNEMEDEALVSFLKDEHPQTIAVVLSFLAPAKSAAVLRSMGAPVTKEVAVRMARMDRVVPEAVAGVVKTIKKKYRDYRSKNEGVATGGLDALVDILKHMPGDDERKIIEEIDSVLPNVSRRIRERIFAFENVVNLTNAEVRILIDEINDDALIARALKGAGDEVRFKFMRNMSQNRATDILADMDAMGSIRLTEVQDSRDRIVAIMRALDDNGSIRLRGGDTYVE